MTRCIRHRAPESTPTMDQLFLQFLDLGKTVVECCIDGFFTTNRIEKYISVNTISCCKGRLQLETTKSSELCPNVTIINIFKLNVRFVFFMFIIWCI